MNPPLRSAKDREAILEGLADGTIEILCSDHAPHCDYEKEVEFDYAPFGITGLENGTRALAHAACPYETHFPRGHAREVHGESSATAQLNKGTLSVGADADVTVFDADAEWIYNREDSASKSKNNPFSAGSSKQGRGDNRWREKSLDGKF